MEAQVAAARVDDVAAALFQELGPMDAMKLQKLLYYSQAWHLAITDQPLFSDEIQAWRDGPVVPHVYQQHRGQFGVPGWDGDPSRLSTEALQLLKLVCTSYGHLSGPDLSILTHAECPWQEARGNLPGHCRSERPISHASMKQYFRGRELAGRVSSDLAVGGLGLSTPDERTPALADEFEKIRTSFHGEPEEHPDDTHGINGVSRTGAAPKISAALAKRLAAREVK